MKPIWSTFLNQLQAQEMKRVWQCRLLAPSGYDDGFLWRRLLGVKRNSDVQRRCPLMTQSGP